MKNEFENENAVETRFDKLSKTLAQGLTRRQSLRRIGGGLAAMMVGPLVSRGWAAIGVNNQCAHWCNENFPTEPARGKCKSDAAHFMGPCYQCGPAAPPVHGEFCNGVCCGVNETCVNGACAPQAPNRVQCICNDFTQSATCSTMDCNDTDATIAFCEAICASHGGWSEANCFPNAC